MKRCGSVAHWPDFKVYIGVGMSFGGMNPLAHHSSPQGQPALPSFQLHSSLADALLSPPSLPTWIQPGLASLLLAFVHLGPQDPRMSFSIQVYMMTFDPYIRDQEKCTFSRKSCWIECLPLVSLPSMGELGMVSFSFQYPWLLNPQTLGNLLSCYLVRGCFCVL